MIILPKLIDGVAVKEIVRNNDDRGFFAEIIKEGEPIFKQIKQTSVTITFPGIIKAFHYHKKQWDVWFVAKGLAQVVLYDLREDSPTYKMTNVLYAGETNPLVISIPPFVVHGYKVLGSKEVLLFYHTTEPYDAKNPDEYRLPFDDAGIGFDWSTKNR